MPGRAVEFLAVYGERGYYVLKAIVEAARESLGRARLGDFDYRSVKRKLREYGLDYNPSLLLSRLEREYGLIETSYKSGSQHWWRITDLDAIEEALAEYEGRPSQAAGEADPRARLLRIQFYSLEPERILSRLEAASRRRGPQALRILREVAFRELPLIVEFLARVEELGLEDELEAEASMARRILDAAERLLGLARGGRGLGLQEEALGGGVGEPLKHGLERLT